MGASTVGCSPSPPYSAAVAVSATAPVAPSTFYHFRLAAADAGVPPKTLGGSAVGGSDTFTTPGPAGVLSESATPGVTSATVRAQLDPFGSATSCEVQYVDEAGFQIAGYASASSVPCTPPWLTLGEGAGFTPQGVTAHLPGLRISTSYHYRFVVVNGTGRTTVGADATFVTFGISSFSVQELDSEGNPYTQAGGHPYKLVTSLALNTASDATGLAATDANVKNIVTELPPGLIGNVDATPRCTSTDLIRYLCPGASQVGIVHVRLDSEEDTLPVYNLLPAPGVPAEFGFRLVTFASVYIYANVRTGGDYGVTAEVRNSSTAAGIEGATVEFWGVPGDPSHDPERYCPNSSGNVEDNAPCSESGPPIPFLTNPTSCTGPRTATLRLNSWQDPADYLTATSTLPAITGCEDLSFGPSLTLEPDTNVADSPSGLLFDLRVPQNEGSETLAQSDLENSRVTLPAGFTVNPAAANGLQACSPAQVGLHDPEPSACPEASRIGNVEIITPLLEDPVKGGVYLAEQENNPFGSLLAIYILAEADGARVKLAGEVHADPQTGQLTTTFDENPQLPFSELKLDLYGPAGGSLATPQTCGTFTAETLLTPWSGLTPVTLSSPFQIVSGCASGFSPSLTAGTASSQAGAFSSFTSTFSRADSEQDLHTITLTTPPGLLGMLSSVPLCPEPQAAEGHCGAESQIGETTAAVGVGPDPYWVTGGKVYLTGPYGGGPFGLSIVVPTIAGPFTLTGNGGPGREIVRAAIHINPATAQVTVLSDPLPSILEGIPTDIRAVNVTVDRPGCMFTPTNCSTLNVQATLTSTAGASAAASTPVRASGCASLPFHPQFTATTQGQASKANGASLTVKVAQQPGEAAIGKVDLALPVALPSRLTTLQKACLAAVFEANPASCPEASVIGYATVHTPVLQAPLTGPAYLVSYGGAAFPDVEFVLQADERGGNVEIVLDGKTQIKNGITYSRFESVPDAPISSFETVLPQGPHSVLTTNLPASDDYNLCGQTLVMPTVITAQNGAVLEQSTNIAVQGCGAVKASKTIKLTLAQQLAKALAKCRSSYKHSASKRSACERKARAKYGPRVKKAAHRNAKKASARKAQATRAAHKRA